VRQPSSQPHPAKNDHRCRSRFAGASASSALFKTFSASDYLAVASSGRLPIALAREDRHRMELTARGAFYIHLLQNWFTLDYISRVWSAAMTEPWPDRVDI
jgi:menaquinone C8-methyltransferase